MSSKRIKIKEDKFTGSGVMADVVTPLRASFLDSVRLHLSAVGGSGSFTIKVGASVYETLLLSQDMTALQDLLWQPDTPIPVVAGEAITFDYPNAGAVTYGLTVALTDV